MKLRDSRSLKQPELMIIPMIDIMFFLLVFFMLSTMYMVDLKTIPIKLPKAEYSAVEQNKNARIMLKWPQTNRWQLQLRLHQYHQ